MESTLHADSRLSLLETRERSCRDGIHSPLLASAVLLEVAVLGAPRLLHAAFLAAPESRARR